MNRLLFTLLLISSLMISCGDNKTEDKKEEKKENIETPNIVETPIYQLFPTKNMWNFLKLDSSNGLIWMVQYSINCDENRFECTLNDQPLISKEQQTPGRFTLIETQNMYNFILLDQITGATYQVQWSFEENKRFVIPISE